MLLLYKEVAWEGDPVYLDVLPAKDSEPANLVVKLLLVVGLMGFLAWILPKVVLYSS